MHIIMYIWFHQIDGICGVLNSPPTKEKPPTSILFTNLEANTFQDGLDFFSASSIRSLNADGNCIKGCSRNLGMSSLYPPSFSQTWKQYISGRLVFFYSSLVRSLKATDTYTKGCDRGCTLEHTKRGFWAISSHGNKLLKRWKSNFFHSL